MTRIMTPELPVLVVDDEAHARQSAERVLLSAGISNILQCQDPRGVTDILSNQEVSVILLDLSMPNVSGEELLPDIISAHPEVPVIIVTGANEVETAVRCMKAGAFDYMVKPVERSRLLSGVQRAIDLRELRRENEIGGVDNFVSEPMRLPQPPDGFYFVRRYLLQPVCHMFALVAGALQEVVHKFVGFNKGKALCLRRCERKPFPYLQFNMQYIIMIFYYQT